jgi:hypothetical protein
VEDFCRRGSAAELGDAIQNATAQSRIPYPQQLARLMLRKYDGMAKATE